MIIMCIVIFIIIIIIMSIEQTQLIETTKHTSKHTARNKPQTNLKLGCKTLSSESCAAGESAVTSLSFEALPYCSGRDS